MTAGSEVSEMQPQRRRTVWPLWSWRDPGLTLSTLAGSASPRTPWLLVSGRMNFSCYKPPSLWRCATTAPGHWST